MYLSKKIPILANNMNSFSLSVKNILYIYINKTTKASHTKAKSTKVFNLAKFNYFINLNLLLHITYTSFRETRGHDDGKNISKVQQHLISSPMQFVFFIKGI